MPGCLLTVPSLWKDLGAGYFFITCLSSSASLNFFVASAYQAWCLFPFKVFKKTSYLTNGSPLFGQTWRRVTSDVTGENLHLIIMYLGNACWLGEWMDAFCQNAPSTSKRLIDASMLTIFLCQKWPDCTLCLGTQHSYCHIPGVRPMFFYKHTKRFGGRIGITEKVFEF